MHRVFLNEMTMKMVPQLSDKTIAKMKFENKKNTHTYITSHHIKWSACAV